MSLITTLITGAGVQTSVTGQSQAEQYILIGDVDTANPLTGLTVEIDGQPFINISGSANLVAAYSKWLMESVGGFSGVGTLIKIGTGRIAKSTNYRFTNGGVTTPQIFGFSEEGDGAPFIATTKSVNASSFDDFQRFSILILDPVANINNVEITFKDGTKSTMTAVEIGALFAVKNQADANGYLGLCPAIDNSDQNIVNVRVNAGAGGAVTVLQVKLPDAAFAVLTGKAQ